MRIVTVTLRAAFLDVYDVNPQDVASRLGAALVDDDEAECVAAPAVSSVTFATPDPDFEDDASVDAWQAEAQRQMGGQ